MTGPVRDTMMPGEKTALAALAARAERAGREPAPVERWNPPSCGDIDLVIHADGRWSYQGSQIDRPALVRLFASVLFRDEKGRDFLVTPAEKLGITVEDAHFQAVEMHRQMRGDEPVLVFRTDAGDLVEAGPDHPLTVPGDGASEFRPYLGVRGRLVARLTRPVALELSDHVEEESQGRYVIRSNGARFEIAADPA